MPDQKLGLVMLTNVSASPLAGLLTDNVWNNLVGTGPTAVSATVEPRQEAGSYKMAQGVILEVSFKNGHLELTVPNQPVYPLENVGGRKYKFAEPVPPGPPPYPLRESGQDTLSFKGLPDTYSIKIKRDAQGKIAGVVIKQPEGEFSFRRGQDTAPVAMTVDELMTKVIAALGGEANLR